MNGGKHHSWWENRGPFSIGDKYFEQYLRALKRQWALLAAVDGLEGRWCLRSRQQKVLDVLRSPKAFQNIADWFTYANYLHQY